MSKPTFAVIECDYRNDVSTYHLAFGPDGRSITGFLTEMGKHQGIARWDAETGKLLESQKASGKAHADGLASSDDASALAVCFGEVVQILDAESLKGVATLKTRAGTLGWSKDGKLLATVCFREVKCWEVAQGRQRASVRFEETKEWKDIRFVGFTRDGKEVVIGRDSGIFTWEFARGRTAQRVSFKSRDGWFWQHGLSPDRGVMLSLSDRGCLLQTDTASWKSKRFTAVKNSHGQNLIFTPDGRLAATETGNGTVFIWDVVEGRPWRKWKKPNYGNLGSIAISPDGLRLACTLDFQPFILDFRAGAKGTAAVARNLSAGMVQCVEMVGGDNQMDQKGGCGEPLNPLPPKCSVCRMPDLDFVTEPYLLNRGIASPTEHASAEAGNFLVRESAKRVLETVAPGQCRFVPTIHEKSREATPWFLAVPQRLETTATPPTDRQRCPQCGEPWCFHHYSESPDSRAWESPVAPHEVFKSRNWGCHKAPFKGWDQPRPHIFGRMLYFSVRLETLFKKLKMRGLVRSYGCKDLPSPEDLAWVEEKLRDLQQSAEPAPKSGKAATGAKKWFADYLKENARKNAKTQDFAAVERKQKLKLPETYKRFLASVGTKTFKDVDGEEGFCVHILPPAKLDFDEFRKTPSEKKDGDEERIEGVVFATTDHGDAFCFDIGRKNKDYPVYKYDHEIDDFEPYAGNFAESVRRFSGG